MFVIEDPLCEICAAFPGNVNVAEPVKVDAGMFIENGIV